jgi:hypothetical protein
MNREDLKVIWFCRECGTSFVFRSDVEDHEENEGHSKISKYDLSSYTVSISEWSEFRDLDFRSLNG